MEDPENINTTHRKRNVCRMLKMLIFILCMTGFGFQTVEFLTNFYTYPTIVNMAIETMEDFPIPALTFCSKYLFEFDKYCMLKSQNCRSPKNMTSFCKDSPRDSKCTRRKYVTPVVYPVRMKEGFPFSASEAFPFDNDYKDFKGPFTFARHDIEDYEMCYRAGNGITETGLRTSRQEGSRPTLWRKLVASFKQSKNVFFNSGDWPFGLLFIHSPFISFKMHTKSIKLKRGKITDIYIRLEVERLLPSPYETDCVDYISLWKKNSMTGPLSSDMCQHACIWKTEYFHGGNYQAEFCYKNRTVEGINYNYDARKYESCKCWKACKDECLKFNYHITTIERTHFDRYDSNTTVFFYIESNKVRVLAHQPQYMDVELFSYIGGFLGCWLGISFWALSGILWKGYSVLADNVREHRKSDQHHQANQSKQNNSYPVNDATKEVAQL